MLLRTPTRSFFRDRPGGAIRVALTGLDFDVRPGGVICAAPAGLPHGISLSGCFNATLAGIAPIPRRSSLLGRLGPSSHRLPQLRGLRHNIYDGRWLRRRVWCGARPGLEGFGSASGAASLATAPETEIWEERLRLAGLGDRSNEHNK